MNPRTWVVCVMLVMAATGCSSYWGRRPPDELKPIDADAPVWIWTNGQVEKWHEVIVTHDSVSGAPWGLKLPKGYPCHVCRRSVARTQVDSMKLGYRPWTEHVFDFLQGCAFVLLFIEDFRRP